MMPSSSTSTQPDAGAATTIVEHAGASTGATREPRLRLVRGCDGWTLYCIEDGDHDDGLAILERLADGVSADLLTAAWHRSGGEPTVLRVELWANATVPPAFVDEIRGAFCAAVSQLGSWGIDAFVLE